MKYTTLITHHQLMVLISNPDMVLMDCRYWLDDIERGRREYRESHIPGAIFAHIDYDLSGPVKPGKTGRHPLPEVNKVVDKFSSWGIGPQVQVVAYDDHGGAMAARLWWMLKWLGHDNVAVLEGGWSQWIRAGNPISTIIPQRPYGEFIPSILSELLDSSAEVDKLRINPDYCLLDSRSLVRYLGEMEPIDVVAGRIPGAISAPYFDNLDKDGNFLPNDMLQRRFEALIGKTLIENVIVYCGSGVTGILNILAMAHIGMGYARHYAGSWSEWITDPRRPIARG